MQLMPPPQSLTLTHPLEDRIRGGRCKNPRHLDLNEPDNRKGGSPFVGRPLRRAASTRWTGITGIIRRASLNHHRNPPHARPAGRKEEGWRRPTPSSVNNHPNQVHPTATPPPRSGRGSSPTKRWQLPAFFQRLNCSSSTSMSQPKLDGGHQPWLVQVRQRLDHLIPPPRNPPTHTRRGGGGRERHTEPGGDGGHRTPGCLVILHDPVNASARWGGKDRAVVVKPH